VHAGNGMTQIPLRESRAEALAEARAKRRRAWRRRGSAAVQGAALGLAICGVMLLFGTEAEQEFGEPSQARVPSATQRTSAPVLAAKPAPSPTALSGASAIERFQARVRDPRLGSVQREDALIALAALNEPAALQAASRLIQDRGLPLSLRLAGLASLRERAELLGGAHLRALEAVAKSPEAPLRRVAQAALGASPRAELASPKSR